MKLLVLAPCPGSAASTRFRLEQFFPALRAAGIEPILRPFLDEQGFATIYRRGAPLSKLGAAVRAVGGRIADLVRAFDVGAVLVHREAALVGPPI
ncbi:MAG: group 1 glycosyl transferase, partial [bacterium]|nr:group 1 glycosyl transferase [bacterium]